MYVYKHTHTYGERIYMNERGGRGEGRREGGRERERIRIYEISRNWQTAFCGGDKFKSFRAGHQARNPGRVSMLQS